MDTNIQVGIRVRPIITREIQNKQKTIWKTDKNCIYSCDKQNSYEFDKVFGQNTTTKEIYDILGKPIVDKVMEGFNGTLFAYGQTASGKTHTIMGDLKSGPGIIPLAVMDVFNHIEQTPNREFLMRASYLEIYNEEITDLVTNMKDIKIRVNVNNEIVIDNITEESIISYDQAMEFINTGKRNRMFGKTNMNERSSRSHVIFRLVVESRLLPDGLNMSEFDGAVIVSELNLVDLAGSERVAQTGAQGMRLKESSFINTSLMTLGLVIRKLSEKDSDRHVPYRDSKLTRILQNSLGGNARTSIICTVSPVVLDETTQTLKFAGRAKNVTNKPIINEVVDGDTKMRRQMTEIRSLKRKIKELEGGAMHGEILQEQDKILAEKQTKIEEQQTKIAKLLKEVVCSGRTKSETRSSRRQTWCPGELSTLRAAGKSHDDLMLMAVHQRNLTLLHPSMSIMEVDDENNKSQQVVSDDSFEKHEYVFLKEEFEEFKMKKEEELKQSFKALREQETETQRLKNELQDQKIYCENLKESNERLKESNGPQQSTEDRVAMGIEWQQNKEILEEENKKLKEELEALRKSHQDLESDIGTFKDVIESQEDESKIFQDQFQNKCKELDLLKQQLEEINSAEVQRFNEKEEVEKHAIENIKAIELKNEELQQQLDTATKDSQEYRHEIQKLNEQLEQLKEMNAEVKATVITEDVVEKVPLNERISELENKLEDNIQVIEEKQNRIIDLERQQIEFQDVYINERVKVQKMEELASILEDDKKTFEIKIKEHVKSIEELTKQLNEIRESDGSTQNAFSSKNKEWETMQNEFTTIMNANKELIIELGSLKQEIAKFPYADAMTDDLSNLNLANALKEQWILKEFEINGEKENLTTECDRLKKLLEETRETLNSAGMNYQNEKELIEKSAAENIETINTKNEELQQMLNSAIDESRKYETQTKELTGQLQQARNATEDILELKSKLQDDVLVIEEKNKRIIDLEQQQTEYQDAYTSEKEKLQKMEERVTFVESDKETYEMKINEQLQSIEGLTKQLNELREFGTSEEHSVTVEHKNQELQQLLHIATKESVEYQSQIQKLNERLEQQAIEADVETDPTGVDEYVVIPLKEKISELESKLQDYVQDIEGKEKQIIGLEQQQTEFQDVTNNNEKEKLQKMEEGSSFPESDKETCEMKISEQLQTIKDLTKELNEMRESDTSKQQLLETATEESQQYRSQMEELNEQLKHATNSNIETNLPVVSEDVVISLKEQISELENKLKDDVHAIEEKEKQIFDLERQKTEFQNVYDFEKQKLQQMEERACLLESDKEALQVKINEQLQSIEGLTEQLNELREFGTSEEDIVTVEHKNQELQQLLHIATKESVEYQSQIQKLNERLEQQAIEADVETDPTGVDEYVVIPLKEKISELESKLQDYVQDIEGKEKQIIGLEQQQTEFQDVTNNNEKEKLQKMEEGSSFPESDKETCEMKISEQLQSIKDLTKELNEMKESDTSKQQQYRSEMEELNEQLKRATNSNIETNIPSVNEDVVISLKEQISELENKLKDLVQAIEEKEKQIFDLERQKIEFQNVYDFEKQNLQQMEERACLLESDKEALQMIINEQLQSIEGLTKQLNELREFGTSEEDIVTVERKNQELQHLLHIATKESVECQPQIQKLNEGLEQQAIEADVEIDPTGVDEYVVIPLKEKISELESKLQDCVQDIEGKEKQIIGLEQQQTEFQDVTNNNEKEKLQKMEEGSSFPESDKETYEMKISEQIQYIKDLTKELNEMKESDNSAELQQLLEAATVESQEYQSRIGELNERLEQMVELNAAEPNAASAGSEDLIMSFKEQISELEKKLTVNVHALEEKEKQIFALEQQQSEFQDVYSNEKEKLVQTEEKCFHLQNEKEQIEGEKIQILNEKQELLINVEKLKDSLSEMQLLLETKDNELKEAHLQLEKHQITSSQCDDLVRSQRSDVETLQAELETKKKEIHDLNEQLDTLRVSMDNNEHILENARNDLILKNEEINKLNQRILELHEEKVELQTMVAGKTSENKDKDVEIEELKTVIKQKDEEFVLERDTMRSTLDSKEELFSAVNDERNDLMQKYEEVNLQCSELSAVNEEISNSLTQNQEEILRLQDEIKALSAMLDETKIEYEDEKSLCKAAYQHEAKQNKSQVDELIKCLKDVQAENKTLSKNNEDLQNALVCLKTEISQNETLRQEDYQKNPEKISSLEAQLETKSEELEQLTKQLAEYVECFEAEKLQRESIVTEHGKQRDELQECLVNAKKELNEARRRYEELVSADVTIRKESSDDISTTNDVSKEDKGLREQIKLSEYRLGLRQEDIVVYRTRIHEQDEEIEILTKKKNEMKGQLKRLIAHVEEMRRPTGNAATAEWEEAITRLDVKTMKLQTKNEELTEKNCKLSNKLVECDENIKRAKIRINQLQSSKSNHQSTDDGGTEELRKELNRKNEEVDKLTDGLKKAYNRMSVAETSLEESEIEYQHKLNLKETELRRILDGLQTAFERYKHYKGANLEKEKEISALRATLSETNSEKDCLTSKLSVLESKIRASMKTPNIDKSVREDISQPVIPRGSKSLISQTAATFVSPNMKRHMSQSTGLDHLKLSTNQATSKLESTNETNSSKSTGSNQLNSVTNQSTPDIIQSSENHTTNITNNNQNRSISGTSTKNTSDDILGFDQKDLSLSGLENDILLHSSSVIDKSGFVESAISAKESDQSLNTEKKLPSTKDETKKRKSDDPLEGVARRRKSLKSSPRKVSENECNQQ